MMNVRSSTECSGTTRNLRGSSGHRGQVVPLKKGNQTLPRRPPASEHAAKRLCLGLVTGH